jgi:hypothetical protein
MKKQVFLSLLMMLIILAIGSCSVVQSTVGQYHTLITYYQDARQEASSFRLCVDTGMGVMNVQNGLVQAYIEGQVGMTKEYRQYLADVDAQRSQVEDLRDNYFDANGNPIPVDQLDLAALANAGALPNGLGGGFTLYVQAFTEAPMPELNPEPVMQAMRTAEEQFNKINACGEDWNKAVQNYNTERNKIPGDVVGTIANELGIKELPMELPYYGGDYTGTISAPDFNQ